MDAHNRNTQIEGLRGIAIAIIVLYHYFCRYLQLFYNSDIKWMHHFGTFGVGIFMMISCYYLVPQKNDDNFDIKQYLKKKFFRLWPGYAIAITVIFVVLQIYPLEGRTSTLIDYFCNLTFINGFIDHPYIDGAHWYLTTLVSIIIIIGIARVFRVGHSCWFYIGWALISIVTSFIPALYLNIIFGKGYVGYVCIAATLRYWLDNTWNKITCGCVAIAGLVCIITEIGKIPAMELIIILPVFYLCIKEKAAVISLPPFVWLGTISYSLYLVHQNLGYVLLKIFGDYSSIFWLNAIITILLITGFALLFHLVLLRISKKLFLQVEVNNK